SAKQQQLDDLTSQEQRLSEEQAPGKTAKATPGVFGILPAKTGKATQGRAGEPEPPVPFAQPPFQPPSVEKPSIEELTHLKAKRDATKRKLQDLEQKIETLEEQQQESQKTQKARAEFETAYAPIVGF
ncbi:MAG: hypothetical protein MHM6MM_006638, partial [Cercozoa sp. M6MM]